MATLMETPILVDKVAWDQGAWCALPAANYMPGVSLEDSGPGGSGMACLNPVRPMGPNGTERDFSRSFARSVPTCGRKTCLGPCRVLSFTTQISTNGDLLHMPHATHNSMSGVHLVSTPIYRARLCGHSVGPFGPPEQCKRCHTFFFLQKSLFDTERTESIRFHRESVAIVLANDVGLGLLGSVRSNAL